jgi:hypothetical protein
MFSVLRSKKRKLRQWEGSFLSVLSPRVLTHDKIEEIYKEIIVSDGTPLDQRKERFFFCSIIIII